MNPDPHNRITVKTGVLCIASSSPQSFTDLPQPGDTEPPYGLAVPRPFPAVLCGEDDIQRLDVVGRHARPAHNLARAPPLRHNFAAGAPPAARQSANAAQPRLRAAGRHAGHCQRQALQKDSQDVMTHCKLFNGVFYFSTNPPPPPPAFQVNPDPDRFRIQGFDDQNLKKI